MKALSCPPSRDTILENSPLGILSVDLNIRCSRKCAIPETPGGSSAPPTRYQTMCVTTGARWSGTTTTSRPFGRVNWVARGPDWASAAAGARESMAVPMMRGRTEDRARMSMISSYAQGCGRPHHVSLTACPTSHTRVAHQFPTPRARALGERHTAMRDHERQQPTGNPFDPLQCHYIAPGARNCVRSQDMADIAVARVPLLHSPSRHCSKSVARLTRICALLCPGCISNSRSSDTRHCYCCIFSERAPPRHAQKVACPTHNPAQHGEFWPRGGRCQMTRCSCFGGDAALFAVGL